jgi:hypothetical protein
MSQLYQFKIMYNHMNNLCIWILKFDIVYDDYRFFKAVDFSSKTLIARYVKLDLSIYNFLIKNNICESLKIRNCEEQTHILCDLKLTTTSLLKMI